MGIRKFEVIEATSQLSVPSTASYFNRILPRNDRFVLAPYLVFGVEEARCRPHNYPQKLVKGDGFGPIIVLLAISDLPILKTHLVVRKKRIWCRIKKKIVQKWIQKSNSTYISKYHRLQLKKAVLTPPILQK